MARGTQLSGGIFLGLMLSATVSASFASNRTVIFLEQGFFGAGDPVLARAVNLSSVHGGRAFQVLALKAWAGDYAPNETSPLPAPDANVVAALKAAQAVSPLPLQIWGGVSLCPGRAFACMLNATQANLTGTQLAQQVVAAGLQGAVIYVSPYCNNPNCQRTTGKYAQGIATIVSAFNAAAPPGVRIALPLNEWDHGEIVAPAKPATILSWQTVFYFTSISACQSQCGSLCGAGEGSTYVTRGNQNFTAILEYLAAHNISWVGQFAGVSTPDATNPPDFWSALTSYSSGVMPSPATPTLIQPLHVDDTQLAGSLQPVFTMPIIADWGGQGDAPFTRPGELDMAASLAAYVARRPSATVPAVLALGDNLYPMGACNDDSLPPYNASCPGRDAPGAGTASDPRFNATFESVFTAPALEGMPFLLVAGNQDAIGNVSASIAYSAQSERWRHPGYWYRVTTQPVQPGTGWQPGDAGGAPVNGAALSLNVTLPTNVSLDILMLDVTLCYGVFSDSEHAALCDAQLQWFNAALAASTASFLLVGAHYPVWSGCAHGSTGWAVETLLPSMIAANVTAYMSGHDHCGQFVAPSDASTGGNDLVFVVAGTGEGCCYSEPNVGTMPIGALKFLLSASYNPANVSAAFAVLRMDAVETTNASSTALRFEYRAADANATLLYISPALLPRQPVQNASGAIVGMAAPDYAAAGLPRPSRVPPVSNYDPHQVTLWLYAPTAGNDTWASWYDTLATHRANVTGAAPCLYLLQSDGSFTSQMPNASATAMARNWTARMASELGLYVRPLLAASGSGMNLLLSHAALAATFINETITEAVALGLAGYNIQLEAPGSPAIHSEWVAFLAAWLDAAAPHGLTLSIIIGGDCRARDWMYMDCGDYKLLAAGNATAQPRPNLRVITEATYTGEPSSWLNYLTNIARGVGTPLAAPGMTYSPPLLNPENGCLPAAAAAGVRELYVWVDTPTGDNSTVAATWAALGWWVAGAANTAIPPFLSA